MRAYELIKETFLRRGYIWMVHVIWLALYGLFWWLFIPDGEEFGQFLFTWSGFFLPLALSAGVFGDDIASGRICVLVTKPFWSGGLYIYRLLGLSLQAAVHLLLAAGIIGVLHALTRRGSLEGLGLWLLASWLLFNTCAALSTSLSVVVGRAYNSLLLFVAMATGFIVVALLTSLLHEHAGGETFLSTIKFPWPPFELLSKFARGEHEEHGVTVEAFGLAKSLGCVARSLMLTVVYGVIGIILLSRRQFSCMRD